jgi:dehydrogenase/reductase SDR family protein 1
VEKNFRRYWAYPVIFHFFDHDLRGDGIIVNMSSAGGLTYLFNTAYGVGKAAQDRMAQDFNVELKGTGVKALAVWPGAVKTELIQENVLDVDV